MNAALLVLAVRVVFEAPLVVSQFLDSDAFVRVIHGPVGSGKSSGCVTEILRRALEQEPDERGIRDTRWAVVRNTYRELDDTTRQTFEQWLGPLGKWREADFAFEIDRPLKDGTRLKTEVLFRALDRPEHVRKLLSLEITGAYINELREIPKAILDGLTMRVGRYPSMKDGGATWDGIWADTNPWAESSEYAELFADPPEGFALFRQPSGLSDAAENVENLKPGYYSRMMAGKDKALVDEYVHGKNPKSDKGSVYGEWIADLYARGRIGEFKFPTNDIRATYDLGIGDAAAIWFWRLNSKKQVDLVDWYENSGKGAEHYFEVMRERGYEYERVFLPHDGAARSFQTGISTEQLFRKEFGSKVVVLPRLSKADGIGAARWMLEQQMRIHEANCDEGLKRLKAHRFEWNEERKVYSKEPLHDWTSHTADALKYVAYAMKPAVAALPKPAPPKPALKPDVLTLDDFEALPTKRGRV